MSTISTITNPIQAFNMEDKFERREVLKNFAGDPRVNFTVTEKYGRNVFHQCVEYDGVERLKAILEGYIQGNRANVSIYDAVNARYQGKTPLFMAAAGNWRIGSNGRKIVELLLALGANRDVRCNGRLPVAVATSLAKGAFQESLKDCLEGGKLEEAFIRLKQQRYDKQNGALSPILAALRDVEQNNSMLLAVKNGKSESKIVKVLKALLEKGENINYKNLSDQNVMSIAIEKGYKDIVAFLIKDPALRWEPPAPDDNSYLHLAAKYSKNNTEILELLIKNRPDLLATRNSFGKTPLHMVTSLKAAAFLCSCAADLIKVRDNGNHTPVDGAIARGDQRLADMMNCFNTDLSAEERRKLSAKYDLTTYLEEGVASAWNMVKDEGGTVLRQTVQAALTIVCGAGLIAFSIAMGNKQ